MNSAHSNNPTWLRALESNTVAAIVGFVCAGLVGQWFNSHLQAQLKEREFQATWLEERGKQVMVAFQKNIEEETRIIRSAYTLAGTVEGATTGLIEITGTAWDSTRFLNHLERKRVLDQKVKARVTFNEQEDAWMSTRDTIDFSLACFYAGDPEVSESWSRVADAVESYYTCGERWYVDHMGRPVENVSGACNAEHVKVRSALGELAKHLSTSRESLWLFWNDPATLRKSLEMPGAQHN